MKLFFAPLKPVVVGHVCQAQKLLLRLLLVEVVAAAVVMEVAKEALAVWRMKKTMDQLEVVAAVVVSRDWCLKNVACAPKLGQP
jgi:hypothetical protein